MITKFKILERHFSFFFFLQLGYPMDAKPNRADRSQGLHRVEGEVRQQGATLLLAAQRLPP